MKRFGVLLLAVTLTGLALVPAATAEKPLRSFLPADDFVFSGGCTFDIGVDFVANNEFQTVFSDGHFLVTGVLKVEFTNLSDPSKSMEANISGPGVFTPTPDGGIVIKAEGPWFFFFFPGDLGPGSPGVALLTRGLSILVIDGSGNASFTPARNTTDLCVALA